MLSILETLWPETFWADTVTDLIPVGLELLRIYILAWRFEQFEEHILI